MPEAEQFALYGWPDFDDAQRMRYLSFTKRELALIFSRLGLEAQVYCALQIGYFKAKQFFFQFSWEEAEEDCAFIMSRYFKGQEFIPQAITKHEVYKQRNLIAALFGYRSWFIGILPKLAQKADQVVRRDIIPAFIVAELNAYLKAYR